MQMAAKENEVARYSDWKSSRHKATPSSIGQRMDCSRTEVSRRCYSGYFPAETRFARITCKWPIEAMVRPTIATTPNQP